MTQKSNIKVGDKFHMLTVVKEVERWVYPSGMYRRRFLMQCDCGNEPKLLLTSNFITGNTQSCGCFNKEKNTKHGLHESRQYRCWTDIKTRCDKDSAKVYKGYGARGISYCEKWKTCEGLWEDMEEGYSDGLTINRRDNDGNYCKENCKWDTKTYQGHQRRKRRGTLCAAIGVSPSTTGGVNANIRFEPHSLHLGAYKTEEEAAEAYDLASEWLYGDRPNKTVSTRPEIAERVQRYYDSRGTPLQARGSENWNATLTDAEALEIWNLLKAGKHLQRELVEMFGVKQSVISSISKGGSWTHITGATRVFREESPFGVHKVNRMTIHGCECWSVSRSGRGIKTMRKNFYVKKLGEVGAKVAAEVERARLIEELRLESITENSH